MTDVIVLKIGGSCLTYKKEGIPQVRNGFLKGMIREIKKSQKQKNFSLIVVHGGGSITHPLLGKYGVAKKLKNNGLVTNKDKLATCKIHWAMNMLNKEVVQEFLKEGVNAWPIQTSALLFSSNGKIKNHDMEIIRVAMHQGYVPILHGDLIVDNGTISGICSGDLVATMVARNIGAKKLFFASDVEGVFISDPCCEKKQKCVRVIDEKKLTLLNRNVKSRDHSGGMMAKIDYIKKYCHKMEVVIFSGLKKGNFEKAFLEKSVGTIIKL